MTKVIKSDRDVNTPSANQDPIKSKFHDFDAMPFLKGVYHGSNAEGHHFICNGEPVLVSAQDRVMKTVNDALKSLGDGKGRLLTIQYLGYEGEEDTGRGLFEISDLTQPDVG